MPAQRTNPKKVVFNPQVEKGVFNKSSTKQIAITTQKLAPQNAGKSNQQKKEVMPKRTTMTQQEIMQKKKTILEKLMNKQDLSTQQRSILDIKTPTQAHQQAVISHTSLLQQQQRQKRRRSPGYQQQQDYDY